MGLPPLEPTLWGPLWKGSDPDWAPLVSSLAQSGAEGGHQRPPTPTLGLRDGALCGVEAGPPACQREVPGGGVHLSEVHGAKRPTKGHFSFWKARRRLSSIPGAPDQQAGLINTRAANPSSLAQGTMVTGYTANHP